MGGPRKATPEAAKVEEPETAVVPDPVPADPPAGEPADAEQPAEQTETETETEPEPEPEPVEGELTIVMKIAITGTRNGEPWPAVGGEISLPAEEAERYVQLGYAHLPE